MELHMPEMNGVEATRQILHTSPHIAVTRAMALQPEFAADWERKTGKPLADILAHRAGLIRFYLSRLAHDVIEA